MAQVGTAPRVLGKPGLQESDAEVEAVSQNSPLRGFVDEHLEEDARLPALAFLEAQGIRSVEELAALSPDDLTRAFGPESLVGHRLAVRRLQTCAAKLFPEDSLTPRSLQEFLALHLDEDMLFPAFHFLQAHKIRSVEDLAGQSADELTNLFDKELTLGQRVAIRGVAPKAAALLKQKSKAEESVDETQGEGDPLTGPKMNGNHLSEDEVVLLHQNPCCWRASFLAICVVATSFAMLAVVPFSARDAGGLAAAGSAAVSNTQHLSPTANQVAAKVPHLPAHGKHKASPARPDVAFGRHVVGMDLSGVHPCSPPAIQRSGSSQCQAPQAPSFRRLGTGTPMVEAGGKAPGLQFSEQTLAPRALGSSAQASDNWLEEVIAGRGPHALAVKSCASGSRRRQRRRLADEEDSAVPQHGGVPPPLRRLEGKAWYKLAGSDYYTAVNEGAGLSTERDRPLEQCQAICKGLPGCNSFAFCPGDKVCWMKSGMFKGNEEVQPHQACTTWYWGPKAKGPPRPTPPPEVPLEPPPRRWCNAPKSKDADSYLTTWTCTTAFGSHYDGKRKACWFRNIYYEAFDKDGFFVAHTVKGCHGTPSVDELKRTHLSLGVQPGFTDNGAELMFQEHDSLEDFLKALKHGFSGRIVAQSGLTLAFKPIYHFNVGHGLWDGLYPAFVSLLQLGLQERPFRAFVLNGWEDMVEKAVPGMYAKVEDIFGSIGGLGKLTKAYAGVGGTRNAPVLHRFEDLVMGHGTNAQKLDMNVNLSLGACRELDACRAFRRRVFHFHGLPDPPPALRTGPFRVIVVKNKRFGEQLNSMTQELQHEERPGGMLSDFQIKYVNWSPSARGNPSLQTGNFTRHLEIIGSTDVHISAPGTGQMYQTFLPDGAVHINLGEPGWANQGYMEEYMAEGAPYLRALYYPRRTLEGPEIEKKVMVGLLKKARQLLQSGLHRPPPVGSNLSPVGKVFKAYCYWAHRDRFGLEAMSKKHITLREVKGETWMGNHFPESLVYKGLPHSHSEFNPDLCLLGALRSSFDRQHPELGHSGRGWFGTGGELAR